MNLKYQNINLGNQILEEKKLNLIERLILIDIKKDRFEEIKQNCKT